MVGFQSKKLFKYSQWMMIAGSLVVSVACSKKSDDSHPAETPPIELRSVQDVSETRDFLSTQSVLDTYDSSSNNARPGGRRGGRHGKCSPLEGSIDSIRIRVGVTKANEITKNDQVSHLVSIENTSVIRVNELFDRNQRVVTSVNRKTVISSSIAECGGEILSRPQAFTETCETQDQLIFGQVSNVARSGQKVLSCVGDASQMSKPEEAVTAVGLSCLQRLAEQERQAPRCSLRTQTSTTKYQMGTFRISKRPFPTDKTDKLVEISALKVIEESNGIIYCNNQEMGPGKVIRTTILSEDVPVIEDARCGGTEVYFAETMKLGDQVIRSSRKQTKAIF
ncbi:MAG: hypothetical protein COT73_07030 [Bdellovibrio sp. CG10_big_fil_rev_8_21_14_0_10_47_8]|nr:MAG: hypothetical protein COT73_07030 [Bdellovibrio sp. CG10_big_fil_rev_8_21_14_0_10_47_8]